MVPEKYSLLLDSQNVHDYESTSKNITETKRVLLSAPFQSEPEAEWCSVGLVTTNTDLQKPVSIPCLAAPQAPSHSQRAFLRDLCYFEI